MVLYHRLNMKRFNFIGVGSLCSVILTHSYFFQITYAKSIDFPTKHYGISIGNSKRFTGLRLNFRDSRVDEIKGINITLWQPKDDNKTAIIKGISLGLIPGGGYLKGIQFGLGVSAEKDLKGISVGLLGGGCGSDMVGFNFGGLGLGCGGSMMGINIGGLGMGCGNHLSGINIGGLAVGCGGDMKGINICLLGMGGGGNVTGLNIGGLGSGAGENMIGFNFGLLGVGAGENLKGINIGGLACGAGENVCGLNIALLGIGAGKNLTGITLVGLGGGAGEKLEGITIAGIGAGSPNVRGITIGGVGVGGVHIKGITMAIGTIRIEPGGMLNGFAISGFNYIRGTQVGLSIGLVNYTYKLKGIQLGIINIVRENPRFLKVLPLVNANFN